jgi:NitT/TauT family transport system permease protein
MAQRFLSLALLAAIWFWAAEIANDPQMLPSPFRVSSMLMSEIAKGELQRHLLATLLRVLGAFVLAMTIGAAIGYAMGRLRRLDGLLDAWLIVFLNLPALVTIVLCYIWIGLTEVAAITAVALNKIPMVTTIIRDGTRALDPRLDNMAKVYRMSRASRLRHVILPQLAPQIASAARTGIALIWKIVLVVEFLGRSNGIGFQIHLHFQLFDVGMVLTYSFSFVAVMLAIEMLVLKPIEQHASQ